MTIGAQAPDGSLRVTLTDGAGNAASAGGGGGGGTVDIDQTTPGTTNGVVVNSSALPTGAATAANQTTGNTSLSTIAGAVTSSVVQSNTKQVNGVTTLAGAGAVGTGAQRVAVGQDTTTIAGSAPGTAGSPSTNVVSVQGVTNGVAQPVTLPTQGYKTSVSATRPSNTTAYTGNDVVGPTAAALTFSGAGPSGGGELYLTSAELEIDDTGLISGEASYNLYLYSVTPPSALADNAAFDLPSGDRASFIGKISLGTPVDEGSTLYVRSDSINAQFSAASGSIYGYLVTTGAYTPSASRVYKITLHFTAL